jgi:hypothetical protein
MMIITMIGLPISTNSEKATAAPMLVERGAELERGPELDEEEHEQEVPQRRQPAADRLAVGRGGERHPGEERADLLAEPEQDRDGRQGDRPGHRGEHQQLRLAASRCVTRGAT